MKRHPSLQPLSREHHQGLLLCWKIRTGLNLGVEAARIKKYCSWFYQNYLIPHFTAEEEHIFPILGNDHEMVKRALAEHRRLHRLFTEENDHHRTINLIEEELEKHIRFEERTLFEHIQSIVGEDTLRSLHDQLDESAFKENTEDVFWVKKASFKARKLS